jgi:hypothetical protein
VGLRHAEIAAALRPENAQVRALLGMALVRTAREESSDRPSTELLDRAQHCFDWTTARSADDPLAALGHVHLLDARGEVERARAALRELLISFPDMADRPHLFEGLSR